VMMRFVIPDSITGVNSLGSFRDLLATSSLG